MRTQILIAVMLGTVNARAERCAQEGEPPLPVLLRRATSRALLEPERLTSLLRRARASALLPRLQAKAAKGNYDYIRNPDSLDSTLVSSATWQIEGVLMWQLDHLAFNPYEVRAIESSGRLAEHRGVLNDRVVQLWTARRRLTLSDADSRDDCAAFTALLDEITGGALAPRAPPTPRITLPGPATRP